MNKKISILIVDDENSVRDSLYNWFIEDGYKVKCAENATNALMFLENEDFDIILADIKMPGMDGLEMLRRIKIIKPDSVVIIMTAFATVDTAVQALKDGAFDYITKPFDPDDLSHLIRNASKQILLEFENSKLKEQVVNHENFENFIGKSPAVKKVSEQINNIAKSNSSVIIYGESGTGKELIAKAIHANSLRKFFPMISVHCGAISESLLESELFGHEKGAFTGAVYSRKGRFEMADNGTIFLDEIATVSTKMQIELLRVLETKKFTRVGGNKEISSDFRIISATNQNLKKLVEQGLFREDLYYRLNVVNINVPPLRERQGDIPLLTEYFTAKFCTAMNKPLLSVEPAVLNFFEQYYFPGNIRELENMIERAVVVGTGKKITLKDLPLDTTENINKPESLNENEKKHIDHILKKYDWNISRSADALQIDRVTLYNKIKKYGLSKN